MFIAHNKVRMNDTDAAGILYFANQFRFVHDAFEDLVEHENISIQKVFHEEDFIFVVVHVEGDYLGSLNVGDKITVQVEVEKIGTTSFTMLYHIYKEDKSLVGKARTVYVTVDKETRQKISIPEKLKSPLHKYLIGKA